MTADLKKLYDDQLETIIQDYLTFLRFKSISSEEKYASQTRLCAEWLRDKIANMGMKVELWETDEHPPVVFASWVGAGKDKPTILLYNHYDVQPVDPISEWKADPFEPLILGKEVFARGASDNKGQCFYVLQALKILLERDGRLPVNVKWCIDGEEEHGSGGLSKLLKEKREELKADYLAVVDVGLKDANTPTIVLGGRGLVCMDLEICSSKMDMHSGVHGGIIKNPLQVLIELLARVKDEAGRILIPCFYDDVLELTQEEKAFVDFSFNVDEYLENFGDPNGGEKDYTPLERAWVRPTFEINGIAGGYGGTGFKTVIPAKAIAKISCRLVPDQDPEKIGKLVEEFLKKNCPSDIKLSIKIHEGEGKAIRANPNSEIARAFGAAYNDVFGSPCKFIYEGGSIPVATKLAEASGSEIVLVGMGLQQDQIHAPNERFDLDRLQKGYLIIAKALSYFS